MALVNNRYDFVLLFDVENGNPNGDPDNNNSPRMDDRTGLGLVTDVCLKRKIRNYVDQVMAGKEGYEILIKSGGAINTRIAEKAEQVGMKKRNRKDKDEDPGRDILMEEKVREFMIQSYYDVRTFGAVMNTGEYPCGIVRGPVQISFAKSVSPIEPQEITITRCCRTKEADRDTGESEMGMKYFIPYGLYRAEGWISSEYGAAKTGLTEKDVELLWEALINMFEYDHAASRGKVCTRRLYVFKHDNIRGKSPSNILFDKINIALKDGIIYPRAFTDYDVSVVGEMPEGVELISMV